MTDTQSEKVKAIEYLAENWKRIADRLDDRFQPPFSWVAKTYHATLNLISKEIESGTTPHLSSKYFSKRGLTAVHIGQHSGDVCSDIIIASRDLEYTAPENFVIIYGVALPDEMVNRFDLLSRAYSIALHESHPFYLIPNLLGPFDSQSELYRGSINGLADTLVEEHLGIPSPQGRKFLRKLLESYHPIKKVEELHSHALLAAMKERIPNYRLPENPQEIFWKTFTEKVDYIKSLKVKIHRKNSDYSWTSFNF